MSRERLRSFQRDDDGQCDCRHRDGAAGSEVALETADVALMSDDLNHLPFAVGLSRQAGRVIRQNLWIKLGIVVILIPATVLGL